MHSACALHCCTVSLGACTHNCSARPSPREACKVVTLTHAAAAPVHNVDGCGAAAAAPAADTMRENGASALAAAMLLPKGFIIS